MLAVARNLASFSRQEGMLAVARDLASFDRQKGLLIVARDSASFAKRESTLATASDEQQHGLTTQNHQNSPNLMVLSLKLIPINILWII